MERSRDEILSAMRKPDAERAAFFDGVCTGDPELRDRIEGALTSHAAHPDDSSAGATADLILSLLDAASSRDGRGEKAGAVIDRYRLLEKLGEGGFGAVWAAEQREPVRRRVALKLIKPGMDSQQIVARFEAERQALALMDHPNIAKVLDAGCTDEGRPYFVMELVRGMPITDYCDREKVGMEGRLRLFVKVCRAVQHAHQKGIIHRDIKPTNILVTLHDGVPVPKVIDFGIAKATRQDLTDKTIYTQFNQFLGTPAYMSPEQAEMSGLDVDTRSDIYSLGVLLYELLTGVTPFEPHELARSGLDGMRKIIREREPLRPSTRAAQISTIGDAPTSPAVRQPAIPSDLDWIVMKCLEKDRTRRYETSSGLARDVERHLEDEPVEARPPSAVYRLRKAWRRNRVGYSASVLVALALLAGISVSLWLAAVATDAMNDALLAGDEAERQRLEAEAAQEAALESEAEAVRQRNESRQLLYAADMKLAQLALAGDNLGRVTRLLERHRPADGGSPPFEWRYLWKQTRATGHIAKLQLQDSALLSVTFSPDDRWLAVGYGGGIDIVDVDSREKVQALSVLAAPFDLHFSRDGRFLFSAGDDELILWSTQTWAPLQRYEGATRPAALSPDGRMVLCNSPHGLEVRAAESGRVERSLEGLRSCEIWGGLASTIAFSLDGTQVVALVSTAEAADEPELRLWKSSELWALGAEAPVTRRREPRLVSFKELCFSPGGRFVVGSSVLGTVATWEAATAEPLAVLELSTSHCMDALAAGSGVDRLIGGSPDQMVHGWRIEEGGAWTRSWRLRGHRDKVTAVAASHDGAIVASGDRSGVLILWKSPDAAADPAGARAPLSVVAGRFNHLHFLSDHTTLVANDFWNETASFWDTESDEELQRFEGMRWQSGLGVSPDDRWLAIARASGVVDLIDIPTRRVVATLRGHEHEVRRLFFAPDGKRLVTATVTQNDASGGHYGTDDVVRLWEVPSGKLLDQREFASDLNEVAVSADGHLYAVQLQTGTIAVGQVEGLRELWSARESSHSQGWAFHAPMAFSPDGSLLAALVPKTVTVEVYDSHRGEVVFTTGTLTAFPLGLDFSPDARSLAVGVGAAVKFWDVVTGQETVELPQPGMVYEIAFAGDGRLMAVGTFAIEAPDATADTPRYRGRATSVSVQLVRAPSWEDVLAEERDGDGR